MKENYKDKGIVITGAGSGMGLELAKFYAALGAHLEISDIDEASVAETTKLCKKLGAASVRHCKLDVSNEEEFTAYAADVRTNLKSIDVVINNAGMAQIARFDEVTLDQYKRVMNVNFYGVLHGSFLFLSDLQKTKGRLVNTSSIFGMIGVAGNSAYCASKFAVKGLNESLWAEAEELGISVTSVHPGGIKTNIVAKAQLIGKDIPNDIAEQFDELAKTTSESAAKQIAQAADARRKRLVIGADGKFVVLAQQLFPKQYHRILGFLGAIGGNNRQTSD